MSEIKKTADHAFISHQIGEKAKRDLRNLISKKFKISSEFIGIRDEESILVVEIGSLSVSFRKEIKIDFNNPKIEENKMCIVCGEHFLVEINNEGHPFCQNCTGKENENVDNS